MSGSVWISILLVMVIAAVFSGYPTSDQNLVGKSTFIDVSSSYLVNVSNASEVEIPIIPNRPAAHGMQTVAGSGRNLNPPQTTIYRVTNLNTEGPGSLQEAIDATGPRTVIFEVSGVIDYTPYQRIMINNPYLTIAGQTAPSPGIALHGAELDVRTHDVLIQHIRVRVGDEIDPTRPYVINLVNWTQQGERDSLKLGKNARNFVIDHSTFSYATDENGQSRASNFTISYSAFTEGLQSALHHKGEHSKGLILFDQGPGEGENISLYRNLFANVEDRTPQVGGEVFAAIFENYIFNVKFGSKIVHTPREKGYALGGAHINYQRPYFEEVRKSAAQFIARPNNTIGQWYLKDWVIDGEIVEDLWTEEHPSIRLQQNPTYGSYTWDPLQYKADSPPITIPHYKFLDSPLDVKEHVLTNAGARPADRDATDAQTISDIRSGYLRTPFTSIDASRINYSLVLADFPDANITDLSQRVETNDRGGWPILAFNQRNLTVPANYNEIQASGYTLLEEWIHNHSVVVETGDLVVCSDGSFAKNESECGCTESTTQSNWTTCNGNFEFANITINNSCTGTTITEINKSCICTNSTSQSPWTECDGSFEFANITINNSCTGISITEINRSCSCSNTTTQSNWSSCIDNMQTRNSTIINSCTGVESIESENRSCDCTNSTTQTNWSVCDGEFQFRNVTITNSCDGILSITTINKTCTPPTPENNTTNNTVSKINRSIDNQTTISLELKNNTPQKIQLIKENKIRIDGRHNNRNLSNILLTCNNSTCGVRGLENGENETKNITLTLQSNSSAICVRDQPFDGNLSLNCSSPNELYFTKNQTQGNITVSMNTTHAIITGLQHSTVGEVCLENWECDSWTSCNDGTQTRTCTDTNACGTIRTKPAESQTCEEETGSSDGGSGGGSSGGGSSQSSGSSGSRSSGGGLSSGSISTTTDEPEEQAIKVEQENNTRENNIIIEENTSLNSEEIVVPEEELQNLEPKQDKEKLEKKESEFLSTKVQNTLIAVVVFAIAVIITGIIYYKHEHKLRLKKITKWAEDARSHNYDTQTIREELQKIKLNEKEIEDIISKTEEKRN